VPGKPRLFCANPFKWFEVTGWYEPKGDVFLCCPTWLETPIGNLQQQSVEEIWNGPTAQEIRRSILDGSFRHCNESRCPFLQTVSGPVQRIEDVEDPDLRLVIEQGLTALPYGPREINCSYDKSCNLSCPSCRIQVIVESRQKTEILRIQQKIHDEALADAHLLYITGSGDPFGSPFFRKWLRTLRREDMPNLKTIRLHTNAQLWTPEMWASIAEDVRRLVRVVEISIDASTAETYAINRRGGSFEKLLENLAFISELRRAGPIEKVTISMVVQENNFREMPGFVGLARRFGFDVAYFSQLVNWGTFSDEEFRRRAIHFPDHPRYREFLELLQSEVFDDPVVYLGNLTAVRNAGRSPRRGFVRLKRALREKVRSYV
jgi:MoaA/NifB/PqqE/SkfB family radical SAM enzyme